MALVYDIKLDNNYDLAIENGDFVIGESTTQHINLIALAAKGEWRETPLIGADIRRLLSDETSANDVRADIQTELERDGMKVNTIELGETLTINAEYR